MANERNVGRATQVATAGFAGLAAFQFVLAAGAPLGDAAWGGENAHLTGAQRVGSAVAIVFYMAGILIVRGRSRGRTERRYRWGTWALTTVLAVSSVANVASGSPWENFVLAPLALVLACLCFVIARTPSHRLQPQLAA